MKLIKLTTGTEKSAAPVWINPMTVQVVQQRIGEHIKSLIIAGGQAIPVWEDAEEIAKKMDEQLALIET